MKRILSIIFVVLLLIPAMSWLSGLNFEINENRTKISPPKIAILDLLDKQFYTTFDGYFNDNFNMRGLFIYTKNWLDYNVWRTLPSFKLYQGTDGWIYERRSIRDFVKEACNEEAEVERLFLQLHALENILVSSGRTFLFTIAPNKSTIYPEHIGFSPSYQNCGKSRYDILLEKQSAYPIRNFVRLDDLLLNEKKSRPLYYKTDSHWNEYGAFLVSRSILKKLFDQQWRSQLPLFEFIETDISGGMAFDIMGLLFTERTLHMKPVNYPATVINKRGPLVSVSDDSYDKNKRMDIVFRAKNPVWHYSLKKNLISEDLPSAIIYSDSYAVSLIQYIVYSFRRLDLYRTFDIPTEESIENLESYDIIMLEAAERVMQHINIDLSKIISAIEKDITNLVTYEVNLNAVIPYSDIKMEHVADGLYIESAGKVPLLSFPAIPASDDKVFRILKLHIESPQPANLKVSHGEVHGTRGKQFVQDIAIAKGFHKVYVPLPFGQEHTLFLESGLDLDAYILHSAEILEFSGS